MPAADAGFHTTPSTSALGCCHGPGKADSSGTDRGEKEPVVSRVDDSLRSVVPDDESCARARAGPSPTRRAKARLESLGFIDQHDGDVVLDSIAQPAPFTGEGLFGLPVCKLASALGADEDLEQFGVDGHGSPGSGRNIVSQ